MGLDSFSVLQGRREFELDDFNIDVNVLEFMFNVVYHYQRDLSKSQYFVIFDCYTLKMTDFPLDNIIWALWSLWCRNNV